VASIKTGRAMLQTMAIKINEQKANKINSTEDRCHSSVPERFREPLMKVADKLLCRDKATFEELTPTEQQLWNSFETDQIYRLPTGEPDTVPEFQYQLVHSHRRRRHG
jgi:hypothetical protein